LPGIRYHQDIMSASFQMVYFLPMVLIDLILTTLIMIKAFGKDILASKKRNNEGLKEINVKTGLSRIKLSGYPDIFAASQSIHGSSHNDQASEGFSSMLTNYYTQLSELTYDNFFLYSYNAGSVEYLKLDLATSRALEINQLLQELSNSNSLLTSFLVKKTALFNSNSRLAEHINSIRAEFATYAAAYIQTLGEIAESPCQGKSCYQHAIAENNRLTAEHQFAFSKTFSAYRKETNFFIEMLSEYLILE